MQSFSVRPRIQVLVLHHESLVAFGLAAGLGSQPDIEVHRGACADASAGPFDVIVCDHDTGVALAQGSRSRGVPAGRPEVRVMVVAGHGSEQAVRQALERGVHGYLLLDAPLEELLDAVRALARGQRHLSASVARCMADSLTRESLTARESEVLGLLARGQCNKAIARQLQIAVGTVKAHVKAIMAKLDAASRTEAVTVAAQRGLIGFHPVAQAAGRGAHPAPVAP